MTPSAAPIRRADRRAASRQRRRRLVAGIAGGAVLLAGAAAGAAVLLSGDDDDAQPTTNRQRTEPTTTVAAAAATTAPPESATPDPNACLVGTYKLATQEYSGPVETAYGPAILEGGEAGRTIEIKADGTFTFTDTGAEDTKFSLTAANPPISGTAKLVADAGGTYNLSANTITVDITTLSGTLTATTDDGQVLNIPLPPDASGVEQTFGFTPNATFSCDNDGVTIQFQVLKLVLDRQ